MFENRWIRILSLRIRSVFRRRQLDEDLNDEIQFHFDQLTQYYSAKGLSEADSQRAAARALDGVDRCKDACRDARGVAVVDALMKDIRLAARSMRANPTFATVVVLTLAIAIGANSAIFAFVNAILLKPLPYPRADRLAMVWLDNPSLGVAEDVTSYANFLDWKRSTPAFEDMVPFREVAATLTGAPDPERVKVALVPAAFFDVMQVAPRLGRVFSAQEEEPGQDESVIISDGLWKRRFGASPDVVGTRLVLDNRAMQVVGVMPQPFQFPSTVVDVWRPLALSSEAKAARIGLWASVIGRLKDGATIAEAQTQLTAGAHQIEQTSPEMRGYGAHAVALDRQTVGEVRSSLLLLYGAVGFLVLIAATNVAALVVARGEARERNLVLRSALGASRGRLISQVLTECVLLSIVAGAAAVGIASWATHALVALAPADLPRVEEITFDGRVFGMTALVTVVTALLVGLPAAWRWSRSEPGNLLRDGGKGLTSGFRTRRLRAALVIGEFALALMLMTGAGLLIRSLVQLSRVDPGFSPQRLLEVDVVVPRAKFAEGPQLSAFYAEMIARIRALPDVRAVGATRDLFLSRTPVSDVFTIEHRILAPAERQLEATVDCVTPDFFETMGVPIKQGRFFTEHDGPGRQAVVIINETMAHRFWSASNPVGQRFKFGASDSESPWLTIVGVVADMHRRDLASPARLETFQPLAQKASARVALVVRSAGQDPLPLSATIRAVVRKMDPEILIARIASIERSLDDSSLSQRRFQAHILGSLSTMAVILAAIGIFGLMHHAVSRRTREIGLRMALGASRAMLLRLMLREGIELASIGIAIGVVGSLAVTRTMKGMLFGVTATDPTTFISAMTVLLIVSAFASVIPAIRAARVDPLTALRHD